MVVITALTAISLTGCNSKETAAGTTTTHQATEPTTAQPAQLAASPEPDAFCSKPVGSTANEILTAMDHDLDATAEGKNTCGSFTDYFVPNAADALRAGATKEQINARIQRAVALAEKGKFISSYERELFSDGGAQAVREYAQSVFPTN
jgi:hypothetical protein